MNKIAFIIDSYGLSDFNIINKYKNLYHFSIPIINSVNDKKYNDLYLNKFSEHDYNILHTKKFIPKSAGGSKENFRNLLLTIIDKYDTIICMIMHSSMSSTINNCKYVIKEKKFKDKVIIPDLNQQVSTYSKMFEEVMVLVNEKQPIKKIINFLENFKSDINYVFLLDINVARKHGRIKIGGVILNTLKFKIVAKSIPEKSILKLFTFKRTFKRIFAKIKTDIKLNKYKIKRIYIQSTVENDPISKDLIKNLFDEFSELSPLKIKFIKLNSNYYAMNRKLISLSLAIK